MDGIQSSPDGYDIVSNTGNAAPFGASVFLGGFWDLEPEVDGPGTPSRCEQALDNIDQIGGIGKVQFTPTFFWDDVGPLDAPEGFDASCTGEIFLGLILYTYLYILQNCDCINTLNVQEPT